MPSDTNLSEAVAETTKRLHFVGQIAPSTFDVRFSSGHSQFFSQHQCQLLAIVDLEIPLTLQAYRRHFTYHLPRHVCSFQFDLLVDLPLSRRQRRGVGNPSTKRDCSPIIDYSFIGPNFFNITFILPFAFTTLNYWCLAQPSVRAEVLQQTKEKNIKISRHELLIRLWILNFCTPFVLQQWPFHDCNG